MKTIISMLAFLSIANFLNAQELKDFSTTNFVAVTLPLNYEDTFTYHGADDMVTKKKVSEVKHDASILSSFPNLCSTVTIFHENKDGSLSLFGNSLAAKNDTYIVIYDFALSQTLQIPINGDNSKTVYFAEIGVSVRMMAKVVTKTRGIDLSNFFKLAIAASKSQVSGKLQVKVNGIASQTIASLIPVTSDLSPSSIENALQSVAAIKSHLYDSTTKITPQFLAFGVSTSGKIENFDFKEMCKQIFKENWSKENWK